jgi:hypothetical protein
MVAALLMLGGAATLATPYDEHAITRPDQVAAVEETAIPTPRTAEAEAPAITTTVPTATPTATPDLPDPKPTVAAETPAPARTPIPLPDAGRAQMARFAPAALVIPRIGIDAGIVPVGVTPEGQLEAPADYNTVGWYQSGPLPGEPGRAVLDGHLDSRTGPAVFYRLGELVAGDEIIVRMGAGRDDQTFVVTESSVYWTNEAPLDRIFGAAEQAELVLITCDGPFDGGGGGYLQRRVIFATLTNGAPT